MPRGGPVGGEKNGRAGTAGRLNTQKERPGGGAPSLFEQAVRLFLFGSVVEEQNSNQHKDKEDTWIDHVLIPCFQRCAPLRMEQIYLFGLRKLCRNTGKKYHHASDQGQINYFFHKVPSFLHKSQVNP